MSSPIIGKTRWLVIIGFFAVLLAWLMPTLAALHHRWASAAMEYGYFVVALSAFIAYKRLQRDPVTLSYGGIPWFVLFLFTAASSFLCNIIGIALVPQLLFPVLLLAAIGLVLGDDVARRFGLPLLFLYFTIPFWQAFEYIGWAGIPLNETLRRLTVFVVSHAVTVTGIPALIDGDYIVLPTGIIEIAEGCSGRAYFLTAVELSAFYAFAFLNSGRNRLILIAVASAQALLGNWIRVFSLTMVGYFSEMQHPLVLDHHDFGWVIFCVTTLPFVFLGRWLEDKEESEHPRSKKLTVSGSKKGTARWIGAAAVFVLALMAGQLRLSQISDSAPPVKISDEWVSSDWVCSKTWPEDSRPIYATADNSWSALCDHGLDQIRVFIADYPFQEQGREAIHFDNNPTPNAENIKRGGFQAKRGQSTTDLLFRPVESRLGQHTQLTWVAYRVAGSPVTGTLDAKFAQLEGIFGGRWDAQVYVLSAPCDVDCSNADTALQRFSRDNSRELLGDRRLD